MGHQEKIVKEQAKFYDHLYITYFMSWRRRGELQKEFRRLNQLLKYIFTGLIDAVECLHQLDHVSLDLHTNNLFLRFSCGCWCDPACIHGSTGVTVVIGNCESAYAVGSLINGPTNSNALKLLDPMHKYKRAEIAYDLLDLVIFITEQLSKISGNTDCEIKMNTWISNIANAVITDPPVKEVLELCTECGIAQNDTIKIIDYLKVSADHYARLNGEHEV